MSACSTASMRSALALARLMVIKMRFKPMTPMAIILKYVRKARITPGCITPASTRFAPKNTTSVSPVFRQSCMKGPGMAMTVEARMS